MSANILSVYECPSCLESFSGQNKPKKCPGCGFEVYDLDIEAYEYPKTLTEQHLKLDKKILYYDTIIGMPTEKMNDIMNDALNIIQTISAKNAPASGIRRAVMMGIRIGEIAKKYDEFIQAGGVHVPSLFHSIEEGEKNEPEKNGARTEPA